MTMTKRATYTAAVEAGTTWSFARGESSKKKNEKLDYTVDIELSDKLSVMDGSVTEFELDAIVNAANQSCMGGGGVDGAIHSAAGRLLRRECAKLNGCNRGEAKITKGYNLPAKYVIHTVGPISGGSKTLHNCYYNSLSVAKKNGVRTLGFCMISTGVFGFPLSSATKISLKACRTFLEESKENRDAIDRIVFVCYLRSEKVMYQKYLKYIFPIVTVTKEAVAEIKKQELEAQAKSRSDSDDNDKDSDKDSDKANAEDEDLSKWAPKRRQYY